VSVGQDRRVSLLDVRPAAGMVARRVVAAYIPVILE
jgi:hypothetical protein